jgi:hypothetical protein
MSLGILTDLNQAITRIITGIKRCAILARGKESLAFGGVGRFFENIWKTYLGRI